MLDGVSRLPEDRREALIMRFALGMNNREIARALGRSDGATKVLIHRAIKQLEDLVADAMWTGLRGRQLVGAGWRELGGGVAEHASGDSGTPPRRRAAMMSEAAPNFQSLLREALAPWSAGGHGAAAGDTLQKHQPSCRRRAGGMGALGDARPRNWARSAAAKFWRAERPVGAVLPRARRRDHMDAVSRAVSPVAHETQRSAR